LAVQYQFLVIQTAFIGDVVLATALVEKLATYYPNATIDMVVRMGNEELLIGNKNINKVWVWNKKKNKLRNLLHLAWRIRRSGYTHVITPHRYLTSGILTVLSGSPHRVGFDKNPLSTFFTRVVPHIVADKTATTYKHDTERNQELIADITNGIPALPRLYPSQADVEAVRQFQGRQYVCIAPTSVWFTKQFPREKWIELIKRLEGYTIYLLGGSSDSSVAEAIISTANHPAARNLCGKLSFLQSAALMQGAAMNYANDSGPQHFATAVGAPITTVFCSTIPEFGFGPLGTVTKVVELQRPLPCRPCGLHGRQSCPEKHFKCAMDVTMEQLLWWTLNKT
jgi:ADP-heptose:LPS heptosyltransferase